MNFETVEEDLERLSLKGLTDPIEIELKTEMDVKQFCKFCVPNGERLYNDLVELSAIASTMSFQIFSSVFDAVVEKHAISWRLALEILYRIHDEERKETKNEVDLNRI